jgi:hypothetical protein
MITQIVHYLIVKMINQIVSYFANKKNRLNNNGKSKLTYPYW